MRNVAPGFEKAFDRDALEQMLAGYPSRSAAFLFRPAAFMNILIR